MQFVIGGEQQIMDTGEGEDVEYEPVGAVVSPFEGGEVYIRESVKAVASALDVPMMATGPRTRR